MKNFLLPAELFMVCLLFRWWRINFRTFRIWLTDVASSFMFGQKMNKKVFNWVSCNDWCAPFTILFAYSANDMIKFKCVRARMKECLCGYYFRCLRRGCCAYDLSFSTLYMFAGSFIFTCSHLMSIFLFWTCTHISSQHTTMWQTATDHSLEIAHCKRTQTHRRHGWTKTTIRFLFFLPLNTRFAAF